MPDDQPSPPPGASSSAPEFGDRRLGRPGVAWTFILLMVAGLVALPFIQPDRARTTSEEDLDKVAIRVMQKQAKLFAAAVAEERQDDPDASPPPFLVGQAEALNAGGVEQRLRYAILAYELKGPKAAREALDEVGRIIEQRGDDAGDGRPEDAEYPADDRRTLAILQTLYAEENVTTGDRDGKTWPLPGIDALSESQRALLQEELGWFGELALDPTATWSEDEVELVPEFNIKTGLTLGRSPLELTVQYSFVSEHFSDASNARHTPSAIEGIIPAYHVVDVSGRYVIQGRFRIEAGINNVTDHDYFTRRATGYPGPGIIPSPPRSIYLTLGTTL